MTSFLGVCLLLPTVLLASGNRIGLREVVDLTDAKFVREFRIRNSRMIDEVYGIKLRIFEYTPKGERPNSNSIYFCVTMDNVVTESGLKNLFPFPAPGNPWHGNGVETAGKNAAEDFASRERIAKSIGRLKSRSNALWDAALTLKGTGTSDTAVVQMALLRHLASKCKEPVKVVYTDTVTRTEWTIEVSMMTNTAGGQPAFTVTVTNTINFDE